MDGSDGKGKKLKRRKEVVCVRVWLLKTEKKKKRNRIGQDCPTRGRRQKLRERKERELGESGRRER